MNNQWNRSLRFTTICGFVILSLVVGCGQSPDKDAPQTDIQIDPPPKTEAQDVVDTLHGTAVADPYRWLEDQEAPATRDWIAQQNAYTDTIMDKLPGKESLRSIYSSLLKTESMSLPVKRGNRYFFTKVAADQDLGIIYMREGMDGEDQVLVDPHSMSDDNTTSVSLADVAADGSHIVYNVRVGGVDEVEVRVMNVENGEVLPDVLPTARYFGAALTPDMSGMYYTHFTTEYGPSMRYHAFGTDIADDPEIFGADYGGETIAFGSLSDDGNWLVATVYHGSAGHTEIHLKNVAEDGPWQTIVNDGDSRNFATLAGNHLLINTDMDAPNRKLIKLAMENGASLDQAAVLLPEKPDSVLEGVSAAGGKVIASYLKDVQTTATIYDLDGQALRPIDVGAVGNIGGVRGQWDDNTIYFSFSTFHIPSTIYEHDLNTGETKLWYEKKIPVDTSDIRVQQVWFTSKDGTKVPMFLVHQKDVQLDGTNPTILYGYGGFSASLTPSFNSTAVTWVKSGGIYAVANLRGGGEFGEQWHQAGMKENKQNVFDDFIAAAEWLIDNKYTASNHLGIYGGSNGGLLVGAVMTQRPDLIGAVVCSYPLLDMIRYHQFMVARFWVPEYGSSENADEFAYILDYSPYHNVKPGVDYPATLFITGDGDTRVAPLHARKMAAMVQAHHDGDDPIMLRYHIKAGHSGGKPKSQVIDDVVEMLSFLKWQLSKPSDS